MAAFLRSGGAVLAGLVLALALLVAVEAFSAVVHPVPPDFDGSMEQMCAHVERYPAWVLAVAVPMWAGTALAATWLAGRLGNTVSAAIVGLLLVAAVICNTTMLPYPFWFKAACWIAIPGGVAAGVWLTHGRNPPVTAD